MIFLNHIGHYGNAVTLQDISEWAGVSVGSVQNCTDRVMIAILEQYNKFVYIPGEGSEDMELAQLFVAQKTCIAWQGGVFAVDGTMVKFFKKPGCYGDTFTD